MTPVARPFTKPFTKPLALGRPLSGALLAMLGANIARADIPVDDAAQLTQRTRTASHTTDTVPVQQKHDKGQKGINCATHTGQRGTTQNNTAQPDAATGAAAVKKYDPHLPATPSPDAKGAAFAKQAYAQSVGDVVAGNAATQATISANDPTYRGASSAVGPAATIMAGYDQNASLGAQNGLSWNQALAAANLLVAAYNAYNISRNAELSQAARAIAFMPWAIGPGAAPANAVCGPGYAGAGTASSPCLPANGACQSLSDGGCWRYRTYDSQGNVIVYLIRTQARTN